jgi:hypothetical protein
MLVRLAAGTSDQMIGQQPAEAELGNREEVSDG